MRTVLITIIVFVSLSVLPIIVIFINDGISSYVLREFVYNHIAYKVTRNYDNAWDKVRAISSWIYINEFQDVEWLNTNDDVVDFCPLFDLVRSIGWCDQKAWGLITLLNEMGIKARVVGYPSHTIVEVIINNEVRYFGVTYNRELIWKNNRYIPIDGNGEYEVDIINEEKPIYGDYNDSDWIRRLANKLLTVYNGRRYIDIWLSIYFKVRENNLVKFDSVGQITPLKLYEYTSEGYEELYKARIYHLLGFYDKAQFIYEELLKKRQYEDESVYYLVVLGLETSNFNLANKYINIGKEKLKIIDKSEKSYLWFIEPYMNKYGEVYSNP